MKLDALTEQALCNVAHLQGTLVKRAFLYALAVLAIASGVAILYPLYSAGAHRWADIADFDLLYHDCVSLMQGGGDEERLVDRSLWPKSVECLKPIDVYAAKDSVRIAMKRGGIGGNGNGYIVTRSEANPVLRGLYTGPTAHALVRRWWSNSHDDPPRH